MATLTTTLITQNIPPFFSREVPETVDNHNCLQRPVEIIRENQAEWHCLCALITIVAFSALTGFLLPILVCVPLAMFGYTEWQISEKIQRVRENYLDKERDLEEAFGGREALCNLPEIAGRHPHDYVYSSIPRSLMKGIDNRGRNFVLMKISRRDNFFPSWFYIPLKIFNSTEQRVGGYLPPEIYKNPQALGQIVQGTHPEFTLV